MFLILMLAALPVWAQSGVEVTLNQPIHVVDGARIKQGGDIYHLWGTAPPGPDALIGAQDQHGALKVLVGRGPLTCFVYDRRDAVISAQCFNAQSVDLSQAMISQGYVLADRAAVMGTNYEAPYLKAEADARAGGKGVWQVDTSLHDNFETLQSDFRVLNILVFVLFILTVFIIVIAALLNKRSYDRIYLTLNQTIHLMTKEAKVRQREHELVAVMLQAELKTNQSKIDAYLVIYEDLLKTLNDPYADHKYLRAGEIVRSAPALDRYVYDANTSKLDALGEDLIPRVIDFYNRVEIDPPYSNLEPDMDHETAVEIVQGVVDKAKALRQDINEIIDLFDNKGFTSVNLMLSN